MDKLTVYGGIAVLVFCVGITVINPPSETETQRRDQVNEMFERQNFMDVENEIASKRWPNAVEVFAKDGSGVAVGIQEGQPVYDGLTNVVLAPGSLVKDFRGVTAIIDDNGNASEIAIYYDLEKLSKINQTSEVAQ
jgi:hypothetical protein